MAVINAAVLMGAAQSASTDGISSNLSAFSLSNWPPHHSDKAALTTSALAVHLPVSTAPRVINATRLESFSSDFYHRVHISPPRLPVGNVVADQVRDVFVWNAFLEPVTLESVANRDAEGIELGGFPTPVVLQPLEEISDVLTIFHQGPPVLNTDLVWGFSNFPDYVLAITGSRVTTWLFPPNWVNGVLERLEFYTDILTSETNIEQRRALRDLPRRYFSFDVLVEGAERSRLDLTLHNWGVKSWMLPIWTDVQWVPVVADSTIVYCDTQYRDFVDDGLVLAMGGDSRDYELLEVRAVFGDRIELYKPVIVGRSICKLYPLKVARLVDQPKINRITDRLVSAEIEFIVDDDQPRSNAALPEYRGWPLLEVRPDESQDTTAAYYRLIQTLDNAVGRVEWRDKAGVAMQVQTLRWLLAGASERQIWRDLCYQLRGRQGAIWLPTWMHDLEVLAVQPDSFDIAHIDYFRFANAAEGRRDIRIELLDGSIFYRRIVASTEVDDITERVGLDAALDPVFSPEQIRCVCFMSLVRLESDSSELHHITDIEGAARAQLTFKGVRDDI